MRHRTKLPSLPASSRGAREPPVRTGVLIWTNRSGIARRSGRRIRSRLSTEPPPRRRASLARHSDAPQNRPRPRLPSRRRRRGCTRAMDRLVQPDASRSDARAQAELRAGRRLFGPHDDRVLAVAAPEVHACRRVQCRRRTSCARRAATRNPPPPAAPRRPCRGERGRAGRRAPCRGDQQEPSQQLELYGRGASIDDRARRNRGGADPPLHRPVLDRRDPRFRLGQPHGAGQRQCADQLAARERCARRCGGGHVARRGRRCHPFQCPARGSRGGPSRHAGPQGLDAACADQSGGRPDLGRHAPLRRAGHRRSRFARRARALAERRDLVVEGRPQRLVRRRDACRHSPGHLAAAPPDAGPGQVRWCGVPSCGGGTPFASGDARGRQARSRRIPGRPGGSGIGAGWVPHPAR